MNANIDVVLCLAVGAVLCATIGLAGTVPALVVVAWIMLASALWCLLVDDHGPTETVIVGAICVSLVADAGTVAGWWIDSTFLCAGAAAISATAFGVAVGEMWGET